MSRIDKSGQQPIWSERGPGYLRELENRTAAVRSELAKIANMPNLAALSNYYHSIVGHTDEFLQYEPPAQASTDLEKHIITACLSFANSIKVNWSTFQIFIKRFATGNAELWNEELDAVMAGAKEIPMKIPMEIFGPLKTFVIAINQFVFDDGKWPTNPKKPPTRKRKTK